MAREGTSPRAARSFLETAATDLTSLFINLGAMLWVARVLGPEQRGVFASLSLLEVFAMPIAMLGFGDGVIYDLSRKRATLQQTFWSSMLVAALHGIATAMVIAVLWKRNWLGTVAAEIPGDLGLLALGLLPLRFGNLMLSRFLLGTSRYRWLNTKTLLSSLTVATLSVAFVCLSGWGLAGAVYAAVLAVSLEFLVFFTLLLWRVKPELQLQSDFIVRTYRYGLKSWVGNLAGRANLRLDQVLLNQFGTAESLGLYAVACRISELIWIVPDALAGILFNRIAGMKTPTDQRQLTAQVHRSLLLVMGPLGALVGLAAFLGLPWLLGPEYQPAVGLIGLLLPGTVLYVSFKVTSKYFGAIGRPELTSLIQIVGLCAGLVAYSILIVYLAETGAALASSLTYAVTGAVGLGILWARERIDVGAFVRIRWADARWLFRQLSQALNRNQHRVHVAESNQDPMRPSGTA